MGSKLGKQAGGDWGEGRRRSLWTFPSLPLVCFPPAPFTRPFIFTTSPPPIHRLSSVKVTALWACHAIFPRMNMGEESVKDYSWEQIKNA